MEMYISTVRVPLLSGSMGGKQRMSNADIATMLKSLPPSAIDRVELVRTPSARYDASGVGGIVNIILKKNVKIGLTGSMNAGFNQGKYGKSVCRIQSEPQ